MDQCRWAHQDEWGAVWNLVHQDLRYVVVVVRAQETLSDRVHRVVGQALCSVVVACWPQEGQETSSRHEAEDLPHFEYPLEVFRLVRERAVLARPDDSENARSILVVRLEDRACPVEAVLVLVLAAAPLVEDDRLFLAAEGLFADPSLVVDALDLEARRLDLVVASVHRIDLAAEDPAGLDLNEDRVLAVEVVVLLGEDPFASMHLVAVHHDPCDRPHSHRPLHNVVPDRKSRLQVEVRLRNRSRLRGSRNSQCVLHRRTTSDDLCHFAVHLGRHRLEVALDYV